MLNCFSLLLIPFSCEGINIKKSLLDTPRVAIKIYGPSQLLSK